MTVQHRDRRDRERERGRRGGQSQNGACFCSLLLRSCKGFCIGIPAVELQQRCHSPSESHRPETPPSTSPGSFLYTPKFPTVREFFAEAKNFYNLPYRCSDLGAAAPCTQPRSERSGTLFSVFHVFGLDQQLPARFASSGIIQSRRWQQNNAPACSFTFVRIS